MITTHKSLAIDFSKEVKFHKTKLKHQRKGLERGLEIRLDNDFKTFWTEVLTPMLKERFQTKPVHSLEEIEQLHSFFPRVFDLYQNFLMSRSNWPFSRT